MTTTPAQANETAETAAGRTGTVMPFRPKFAIYHASSKGTGCAVKLELHPAHDRTDGSIWMTLAGQMVVGDLRGPNPTYPRFDWENAVTVKLGFDDLCQMLQVFRGECESAGDGRGLYHTSSKATTKILFRHMVDPVCGYSLEVYRTPRAGGNDIHMRFVFSPAEACGVCEAIAGSMGVIAFGIPVVVPHDTSAYESRERGRRDVAAA